MVHKIGRFSGLRFTCVACGLALAGVSAITVSACPEALVPGAVTNWIVPLAIAEGKDEIPLPKNGSLSTTIVNRGKNATSVAEPWGGVSLEGRDASPISGSVSRVGKGFIAKVFNNSEDTYSADVKIVQKKGKNESPVKTDSFSMTLKPGESTERTLSSAPGLNIAELKLERWKKLSSNKPAASSKATP